jgi:hypothetical protein
MAFHYDEWVCPTCEDFTFTSYGALQRHLRQWHTGSSSAVQNEGNDSEGNDNHIVVRLTSDVENGSVVTQQGGSHIVSSVEGDVSPRCVSNEDESVSSSTYLEEAGNLNYFTQFMDWGSLKKDAGVGTYTDPQLVSLRFLQALETGDSLSMARQQTLLSNAISMGGRATFLQRDIRLHWKFVSERHELLTVARGLRHTEFSVPPEVQQLLGHNPPLTIPFSCENIVLVVMRLLLLNPFSGTKGNLQFKYEESSYYDDYCTGDRWKRVMDDVSKGKFALFFTLFIDSLIQDKGGFVSAKGCVLTLANYRWFIRGASCCKAGICTFPDVVVPRTNAQKRIITQWKKQLFHNCIEFMLLPVHEFNARGGAFAPLNNSGYHFQRMILLALITDAPEGRDLGGTISACHHCFCPKQKQGDVTAATEPRTALNMAAKTKKYRLILKRRVLGTVTDARKEATKLGISVDLHNGFTTPAWCLHNLFGPCPINDHVHGALPQGMLHGLHEGLIKYAVKAILMIAVASAIRRDVHNLYDPKWTSTSKKKDPRHGNRKFVLDYVDDALRTFYLGNARCSDVELQSIGVWEYFPKDVTEGLVGEKTKRLNGMCYWTMMRQIHLALCASNYMTRDEKVAVSGMCQLGYDVLETVHNPVRKDGNDAEDFQVKSTEYVKQLIVLWKPFSKSKCESIKWHLVLHWLWYLRQMGAFSDERTLEKELGILFKKPYKLTNHRADYNDQMGNRTQLKQQLQELCAHAGIGDTLLQSWNGLTAQKALAMGVDEPSLVAKSKTVLQRLTQMSSVAYEDFEYSGSMETVKALLRDEKINFPVVLSSSMKLSLPNRCVPANSVGRDRTVTFRAKAKFHGSPWYDAMRYYYKMDLDGREVEGVMYGRCVCFLSDATGKHYAVLRSYDWYDGPPEENPNPAKKSGKAKRNKTPKKRLEILDPLLQMVPLKLSNVYVLAETQAILNGGLIVEDPLEKGKYWAVQGVRELNAFMASNLDGIFQA